MKRIFDQPGHRHYGPARRTWVMLEQLFADDRGVANVDFKLAEYQRALGYDRPRWDEHLSWLIDSGQTEAAAQRTVVQQMIVAFEWIA